MIADRKIQRINYDKYNDENKKGFDLITLDKVAPNKFKNEQTVKGGMNTWEKALSNSSSISSNSDSQSMANGIKKKEFPTISSQGSFVRSSSVKPMIHTSSSDFYAPGKKGYMPITDKAFLKIEKPLFAAIKTGGFNHEKVKKR